MTLYWIVKDDAEGRRLFYLQEAGSPLDAQIRSDAAGFHGKVWDVIPVDSQTATRIKKEDTGRPLSVDEAREIIEGGKA